MTRVLISTLFSFALVAVLIAACGWSVRGDDEQNEIHMGEASFAQPSITISKGSSITLVDDTSVAHIIQNGYWENGTAKPAREQGAPQANIQFTGDDRHMLGPFNATGVYHLYCTIHFGMDLTVIVR